MSYKLLDCTGRQIFPNDEYFVIEDEHGFHAVHEEEIQNYMYDKYKDERLLTDDFEHLKELLRIHYDIYSERLPA